MGRKQKLGLCNYLASLSLEHDSGFPNTHTHTQEKVKKAWKRGREVDGRKKNILCSQGSDMQSPEKHKQIAQMDYYSPCTNQPH